MRVFCVVVIGLVAAFGVLSCGASSSGNGSPAGASSSGGGSPAGASGSGGSSPGGSGGASGSGGSSPRPTAAFTYSPSRPVIGQQVTFNGSGSSCLATPCAYKYIDTANGATLGTSQISAFTFSDAGTKFVQLTVTDARNQTSSVEHDVVVSAPTATRTLAWSPPPCGGSDGLTCATLKLSNTGSNQAPKLDSNTDYKIVLPTSGPLVGGLEIRGGHSIQIIGGEIDLTYPCSDASSACHGVYIEKTTPGEVYLEGVWIHNPNKIPSSCAASTYQCSTGDGIDVDEHGTATPYDVVLQNLRIDGISGCSGSSNPDHADVFQPYDAMGATIQVDYLTGVTNCQGMQIGPDLAWSEYNVQPTYDIRNVNMDVTRNPYSGNHNRYVWWLTYGLACNSGPISLTNDYAQEWDGTMSINAVWPDTNQPASCESVWSPPTLSFPNSSQISGVLTEGLPPVGDYVPGGGTSAGTGYKSPGYK